MAPFRASSPPRLIVFTDLDGTLLDETYSAAVARPALALLAARGVPVIACSSKTAAEQRRLRPELGLIREPFIVENGSAVLVPDASGLPTQDWPRAQVDGERIHVIGQPADAVRAGIRRAAAASGVRVTGYADLSVAELAGLTGLSPDAAACAREREFSETLVDDRPDADWARFARALATEGLACRQGGRFRTVTSAAADKGAAIRRVIELYAPVAGQRPLTAGLGDSANDEGLLRAVDVPFLLAGRDGTLAAIDVPHLRRLAQPGPRGWHQAILELLESSWLEKLSCPRITRIDANESV